MRENNFPGYISKDDEPMEEDSLEFLLDKMRRQNNKYWKEMMKFDFVFDNVEVDRWDRLVDGQ